MELFLVCTCNSIIHVWFELLLFIIPVLEHARFWGRYLDAAGLDSINGRQRRSATLTEMCGVPVTDDV